MHNKLMPEVIQVIKDLDSGKITCFKDVYYLKVPKDMFSPYRDCIVKLVRLTSGWHIAEVGNEQFYEQY